MRVCARAEGPLDEAPAAECLRPPSSEAPPPAAPHTHPTRPLTTRTPLHTTPHTLMHPPLRYLSSQYGAGSQFVLC